MDGLDYLFGALHGGYVGTAQGLPTYHPMRSFNPAHAWKPPSKSWGPSSWNAATALPPPTAGPPEKIQFGLPFSSDTHPPAPASTQGDVFGSIGAAVGNLPKSGLNLGNAIPWFMERLNVLSHAAATSHVPGLEQLGQVAQTGTGSFLSGVEAVSNVVAPIIDFLPNAWRDANLRTRAKAFTSAVKGESLSPWDQLIGSLVRAPMTTGQFVSTGQMQLESYDLPESIKLALAKNPNVTDDQIDKMFDDLPEGRQWSYRYGGLSTVANVTFPLAAYVGEGLGTSAALGAVRGAVGATELGGQAFSALGRTATIGGREVGLTTPFTIAAKLQKYAVASGATLTGVTTALDAVARYQGNQAAIDFFDRINREHPISDNPSVQLATSFSVNPFEAVGLAKKGIVRLKSGLGDLVVPKSLGSTLSTLHDHNTWLLDRIAQQYQLPGRDAARKFLTEQYDSRGAAFDEQVTLAADVVLDPRRGLVPRDELESFNALHLDGLERTKAALETYGDRIANVMKQHPDMMAARFRQTAWEYHQYPGDFHPEVAASNARDYRMANSRNYELRAQLDAVTGYTELIPPEGAALIRSRLDAIAPAADSPVPVEGLDGLQGLVKDFPALRTKWQSFVRAGTTSVPRSAVEEMLASAEADYAHEFRQNPIKATTGADPILWPDSPTPIRDLADALGVQEPIARALSDVNVSKPSGEHMTAMRAYLEHIGQTADQVAAMSTQQVVDAAMGDFSRRTAPWYEQGERVAAARTQIASLRKRLGELTAARSVEADVVARELGKLEELARTAGDPITPFAERFAPVKEALRESARSQHLAEMAERKVIAQDKLRQIGDLQDAAQAAVGDGVSDALHQIERTREGGWAYSAGLPAVPDGVFARLQTALFDSGKGTVARAMTEKGRAELWDLVRREYAYGGPFWRSLSRAQRRAVDRVTHNITGALSPEDWGGRLPSHVNIDDAMTTLIQLRQAYDDVLEGSNVYHVARTANLRGVPDSYVQTAEGELAPFNYDPLAKQAFHETVEQVRVAIDGGNYSAIAGLVEHNRELEPVLGRLADDHGITEAELLADPAYAKELRDTLVPPDYEAPLPGVHEDTPLDAVVTASDPTALRRMLGAIENTREAELRSTLRSLETETGAIKPGEYEAHTAAQLALERHVAETRPRVQRIDLEAMRAAETGEPIANVSKAEATRVAKLASTRRSSEWRHRLVAAGADLTAAPAERLLTDPANSVGLQVLSLLNHGVLDTVPSTIAGTVELLRQIERGSGTRLGLGESLQAEAQKVGEAIVHAAVNDAAAAGFATGVFEKGVHPALLGDEDLTLAREILGRTVNERGLPIKGAKPVVVYDPADPAGSLQYGLKKRPSDAVVLELAQVPGLSEEFVSGHFQPWEERVATARVRQAYNYIFGKRANADIAAQARMRFVARAATEGVDPKAAAEVWDEWQKSANQSHYRPEKRVDAKTGTITYMPGDSRWYGTARNIPTNKLGEYAQARLDEMRTAGTEIPAAYYSVDFGRLFRESSSPVMGFLADHAGSLGDALAAGYGKVTTNAAVTTLYYVMRFATDLRYHAMNWAESQILYTGRAALKPGEIDRGMFGQSEAYLRNQASDPIGDLGYATGRSRMAYAYRTFLKEQPETLRGAMKGLDAEAPGLMDDVLREIAAKDPELSKTIGHFSDGNVNAYLREMNDWYEKKLGAMAPEEAEGVTTFDDVLAKEMAADPAMSQVYSRIQQANDDLWHDIRNTFFGSGDRSRAERVLNHYLLFWPLSYQVKSSKWLMRVLFDKAGGLPTNAFGAYELNHAAQMHQELLTNEPDYKAWFEKHPTLVFAAQMLLPITWDSMGTSLNPALRAVFFGRSKSAFDIGPVWTYRHMIQPLSGELYSDLSDVPGIGDIYRATAGKAPPKASASQQTGGH